MSHTHTARKASRLAVVAALAAVGALLLIPSGAAAQFGNFPPDGPGFGNFPPDEPRFGNFPPDEPRFGNFPPEERRFGNFPPESGRFGNFPPEDRRFGNFPPEPDAGDEVGEGDEGDEIPGDDVDRRRGQPLEAVQVPAAAGTGLADTGISEALLLALLAGGIVAAATAMRMRVKREGA